MMALNNSREQDLRSKNEEQHSKLFQSEKHYSAKIFRP